MRKAGTYLSIRKEHSAKVLAFSDRMFCARVRLFKRKLVVCDESVSKEMMLFASVFDAFSHEFSKRVFVNCLPVIKKFF